MQLCTNLQVINTQTCGGQDRINNNLVKGQYYELFQFSENQHSFIVITHT